ncbi:DsbA family oxidoreductase [Microbacterium sp.]|uniref:DsbA family oxidoreductase n=1 Tax=Microbacterium sp. TaxID=51671 RepID=UPI002811ECB5|nr:DsbA family oxidoreductase [Microbacterium sp.]
MIDVEVFFDVLCPWCYIGKRRLATALASPALKEAAIRWRSLELDPDGDRIPGPTAAEVIGQYQPTPAHAEARVRQIREIGAGEGLELNLHLARPVNSLDAHRLIKLATAQGLTDAAVERLFSAYHRDALIIADPEVLIKLGGEIGLDPRRVREMLDGEEFIGEVRADEQSARERHIHGVPTIVVGGATPISAVQDPRILASYIERAARM